MNKRRIDISGYLGATLGGVNTSYAMYQLLALTTYQTFTTKNIILLVLTLTWAMTLVFLVSNISREFFRAAASLIWPPQGKVVPFNSTNVA